VIGVYVFPSCMFLKLVSVANKSCAVRNLQIDNSLCIIKCLLSLNIKNYGAFGLGCPKSVSFTLGKVIIVVNIIR
jgi:hypothetical protein